MGEWEKKRLHVDARRIFGPGNKRENQLGRVQGKSGGKMELFGLDMLSENRGVRKEVLRGSQNPAGVWGVV